MKLVHPEVTTIFQTDPDGIQTIVIENPKFYREILCDLTNQMAGRKGKFVLSEKGKILDISKSLELLDDFWAFEMNKKTLLTKIISSMEKEAADPVYFIQMQEVLNQIELFLDRISMNYKSDLQYNRLSIGTIMKAVGIEIRDDYDNHLERLIDYMEMVREFDRNKLFITVNLRNFFSDDETKLFIETIQNHEFHVIMLEGQDHVRLDGERRTTIDIDLCEF